MKKSIVDKTNYSIKRRFFDASGNPLPWQDHGFGLFIDRKTIRKQVDLMVVPTKKTEIEIILNKEKVDYDLYPTKENLIYDKRTNYLGINPTESD
jgi:hypothetical protein